MGKAKSGAQCNVIKDENGNTLKEQSAVDYMNTYYATAGEKLASVFNNQYDPAEATICNLKNKFSFRFVTEKEVVSTIKPFSQFKLSVVQN